MTDNFPDHIRRRLQFSSPEGLKKLFRLFPLDKDFIDWVVGQGFKIVYRKSFSDGMGSVSWVSREINVSPKGDSKLVNLVKVHELVHIALTREINIGGLSLKEYEEYEKAIDEIAMSHINNSELMLYLDAKLPFLTVDHNNLVYQKPSKIK